MSLRLLLYARVLSPHPYRGNNYPRDGEGADEDS